MLPAPFVAESTWSGDVGHCQVAHRPHFADADSTWSGEMVLCRAALADATLCGNVVQRDAAALGGKALQPQAASCPFGAESTWSGDMGHCLDGLAFATKPPLCGENVMLAAFSEFFPEPPCVAHCTTAKMLTEFADLFPSPPCVAHFTIAKMPTEYNSCCSSTTNFKQSPTAFWLTDPDIRQPLRAA